MSAVAQKVVQERAPLSNEELRLRRKAVDFGRVNCELEGLYESDPVYDDLCDRYAKGEIDNDVLDAYVDKKLEERINAAK